MEQPNPIPPAKRSRHELMVDIETDPELLSFFEELQEILLTDPNFILTIKFIARRVIPASLDEGILETEARVSQCVTKLVELGLMSPHQYKTEYLGDYLPTYVVVGLN